MKMETTGKRMDTTTVTPIRYSEIIVQNSTLWRLTNGPSNQLPTHVMLQVLKATTPNVMELVHVVRTA